MLELVVVKELEPELPRSPGVVHLKHGLRQLKFEFAPTHPPVKILRRFQMAFMRCGSSACMSEFARISGHSLIGGPIRSQRVL